MSNVRNRHEKQRLFTFAILYGHYGTKQDIIVSLANIIIFNHVILFFSLEQHYLGQGHQFSS